MTEANDRVPELSLVMPCYNEEVALRKTVPSLAYSFARQRIDLQLVLVDNGSTDQTGKVIDELIAEGLPITKVTVEVNQGYGYGILRGLEHCQGKVVGFLHADGQVAADDVVMIYRLMSGREGRVLVKARRRFRQDSWKRKIVSICYNGMMLVLFGWMGSIDINGSPKLLSRENLKAMRLSSADWFLDPEMIIKAKHLGLRVIEVDVEGYARQGGASNVRFRTCLEFLKNILVYRIGGPLRSWKNSAETIEAISKVKSIGKNAGAAKAFVPAIGDSNHAAPHQAQSGTGGLGMASLLDKVCILEQKRFDDSRGFLQKVLTASQCMGDPPRGEVYVTTAYPAEAKGNHFHRRMGEWFSVIQGEGTLEVCDPESGHRRSVPVSSSRPCTVYVPAGLAHAIVNRGDCPLICVAWAEAEHDPQDVFPYAVWPPERLANAGNPESEPGLRLRVGSEKLLREGG